MQRRERGQDDRYYYDEDEQYESDRRREQFKYGGNYGFGHDAPSDVTKSTVAVKDVIVAFIFIVTTLGTGVGIWTNLNNDLITQKMITSQLKEDLTKEIAALKTDMKELKVSEVSSTATQTKDLSDLEKRIQDLDATVTQIYQTLVRENKK